MIVTISIATAATCSYDCPFIWQFRPDTSYKLFGQQAWLASIFESRNHWLDNLIKAFESCKHPCCRSFHSSEILLQRTWKNNCHDTTTNPESGGIQECLRPDFASSWCTVQLWNSHALCWRWEVGKIPCHLCMDRWLLLIHSLGHDQAAPLPSGQSTEIVVWRREFIIMAI